MMMDEISINPEDAPDILANLVDQFCSIPVDYSDIPVEPDKLDGRSLSFLKEAVSMAADGEAVKAYDLVSGSAWSSYEFYYLLGKILFGSRCFYEASHAFAEALLRFDGYGEIWFHKGITDYQMGLYTEAFLDWGMALRVNENHEDAKLMTRLLNVMVDHGHPFLHNEAAVILPIVSGRGIDVGCGARKTHPDAIGVDLTAGGSEGTQGGEAGRVSTADIRASGDNLTMFKDGELDYVIARHNLEHYVDPIRTLQEWARTLKPGGVIGLVLPDDSAFDTIHADDTHTHTFTPDSLRNMITLLPELGIVEIGVAEKGWSFYAIVEKVRPGSKPSFPYREKVNEYKASQAESRATMAMTARRNDVAAAALKKLVELRPDARIAVDPESLHPCPFKGGGHIRTRGDGSFRIVVLQYSICAKDWAYTLEKMGHTVLEIPFGHRQEMNLPLEKRIKEFDPDFVVSANYRPYVGQAMGLYNIPYVCWAIDTFALDSYWRRDLVSDNTHMFHFSKINVEKFRSVGFQNVTWLPLAANLARFRPFETNAEYSCDISFVGTSAMVNGYTDLVKKLHKKLVSKDTSVAGKNELFGWARKFGKIIERQADNLVKWNGPGIYGEIAGESVPPGLDDVSKESILFALGDQVTANQRAMIVNELCRFGVHLWGDNWWRAYESRGAVYRGPCDYHSEVPEIYSSSKINIHTNRIYHEDVAPLRLFDILACRGFLLAEYRVAYEQCYEPGKDLVCFESVREVGELAEYYLNHPKERESIAESGYRATLERHSLESRWKTIIRSLQDARAIGRAGVRSAG